MNKIKMRLPCFIARCKLCIKVILIKIKHDKFGVDDYERGVFETVIGPDGQ
ncbi:MAG: hypothetical protein NTZ67_00115 [Gammaproteobacteria bacterium]|nr:hypothetical protein [Gammaproteobacteria bacterium]